MKIINRKIMTFAQNVNNDSSFIKKVMLSFNPDIMIVKHVTYGDQLAQVTLLRCSAINDYLCTVPDNRHITLDNVFPITSSMINTEWSFSFHGVNDALLSNVSDHIVIQLEFLQHEK